MTRGVCSRHCFDRIDSVRVDRQAGSSLSAVLSCKVPARFTCLAVVMIWAGRSRGVEDHGNNTLSVLFKLKLEQMSCFMFVCWPKALCRCCRQEAFPKVPNSPKFPASLAMGFLEKKKKKNAAELPVSQGTERMRLV